MSRPRVVVLDYGSGNVHSATRALDAAGADVRLTADALASERADGLAVPGVGAFAACIAGLRDVHGDTIIAGRIAAARPLLGICVGHQVLFGLGREHGVETPGLGVYPGAVESLATPRLPHMGWNTVDPGVGSILFSRVEAERFYFVHSYAARPSEALADGAVVTTATHQGVTFVAAVERGPVASTQFHPEKSGRAGARLLANWVATL